MLKNFWMDENGAIVSIEIVLVVTIAVLALIVGLSEVAVAVNNELNDISNAVGALRQEYGYTGFTGNDPGAMAKSKSFVFGTTYFDVVDDCDLNLTCDLVTGASAAATAE